MDTRNHFIAGLSDADYRRLEPHMTKLDLLRNQVLCEPDENVAFAYLPLNSILSVITTMGDGVQVESRTIGRESGHGLLHALGSPYSQERILCQVGGEAIRIPLSALAAAAQASPSLTRRIAQHAQATFVQVTQTAACNALHKAHARLARWLLMTRERLGSDTLPLTQEHLSIMLGVQRTTITPIAQYLQDQGAIAYSRGTIRVLDPDALHRHSCECYRAVRQSVEATFQS